VYRDSESGAVARQLDLAFHALADRTRRQILRRLTRGPATVTEVARQFEITLPAVSQHLAVLERAGLIARTPEGRLRHCSLDVRALQKMDDWLGPIRAYWTGTLARLGEIAEETPERRGPHRTRASGSVDALRRSNPAARTSELGPQPRADRRHPVDPE
jgi:DNA-binding transcriptional ArsR family regulator